MGWLRTGMVVTGLGGAGLLALGLVDCAAPTQIVVEVYSDACTESGVKRESEVTGIAVGTPAEIDDKLLTTFQNGCKGLVKNSTTERGVGTLTITPSGDKDEEVAIKVVSGLSKPPDDCVAAKDNHAGCIVHRRITRFIPNTTQRVTVRLSLKCLNIRCDPGFTCDDGKCTRDSDLLTDGGTVPDAQTTEGSVIDSGAGTPDACTGCVDQCLDGECRVDCTKGNGCPVGELCAPTLPCVITCGPGNKCQDIRCTTSGKCTVDCTGPGACGKVACNAASCEVDCEGTGSCNQAGGIHLDASTTSRLTCENENACEVASCGGGTCELRCEPNGGPKYACPEAGARPCSATDCTKWDTSQQR